MREATAVKLCAAVLLHGRTLGRYSMMVGDLPKATGLSSTLIDAAVADASDRGWVFFGETYIVLKASGIHVAKESLDLPR